jgi:acrylyl-CoA reductase (NADPH)
MKAWIVSKQNGANLQDVNESILSDDDVTVDIEYSSMNYKDGMALAGNPGVARVDPLIPGIDLVGTVAASSDTTWKVGERVLLNGWGVGEVHHGGFAERARVKGTWLTAVPDALSARRVAAIGTAGFTAMLAVMAVEHSEGSILVTGAAGGVGSIAIALLAQQGRTVIASTGRPEEASYLRSLGASEIIDRNELTQPGRPLQRPRWGAAIDSVGGQTLATVLAQTHYAGAVAACGLAGGFELPTTVMPFILRGVTLKGINSVDLPSEQRVLPWQRLAKELDLNLLDSLTRSIPLAEAQTVGQSILQGRVRGRTVVEV